MARSRTVKVLAALLVSMAMGAILAGSYREWHPVMENCAVSELVFAPAPALLSFNFTDHLAGL